MIFKDLYDLLNLDCDQKTKDQAISKFCMYIEDIVKNSIYFHWKIGQENIYLIDKAISKGAVVITSEKKYINANIPNIIYVESVRQTLKHIAKYQRNNFTGEVIAITGSVGKSSVKNMISGILTMLDHTLYTLGNENAWLGIYCTLCNIKENTKYVVLEVGASGPNTLSVPIKIVRPTYAVLLDVNYSHQEKYADFDELLKEKSSIISALNNSGNLIISNQTYLQLKSKNFEFPKSLNIKTVGFEDSDLNIKSVEISNLNTIVEVENSKSLRRVIQLNQCNYASGINAIYSWAVLENLGFSLEQFNSLIKFYKPLPRRFERLRVCDSKNRVYELIDDSYNASPISTMSLIKSISKRKARRKILILGDMLELGDQAVKLHQQILNLEELKQLELVILTGEIYGQCVLKDNFKYFDKLAEITTFLDHSIHTGDLVVLKASNAIKLYALRMNLLEKCIHISNSDSWCIDNEYARDES